MTLFPKRLAWRVGRKLYCGARGEQRSAAIRLNENKHAIAKAEGELPDWLAVIIEERCPGLFGSERLRPEASLELGPLLDRRMMEWVEEEVSLPIPNREAGCGHHLYAIRNPVYARDWAYWRWCEGRWEAAGPSGLSIL